MPWSRMHSENLNAAASASSAADAPSLEFVESSPSPTATRATQAIPTTSTLTPILAAPIRLPPRNLRQLTCSLPPLLPDVGECSFSGSAPVGSRCCATPPDRGCQGGPSVGRVRRGPPLSHSPGEGQDAES